MDHLLVPLGSRRVLVADVATSDDGHGIGYGILLKRIDRVLTYARAMDVAVFYVREARSINTAVFRLRSGDVEILGRSDPRTFVLHAVWIVTAPFRYRAPWLWVQRSVARALLGRFYETVERSPRVPRAVRRFIVRPRPFYRRLRTANAAYARLTSQAWKQTFKGAERRLHEAEREGRELSRRLTLPPVHEREAIAEAAGLGISATTRIVTVHVREAGYRADAGLRQRPWDALRNARVETYVEAFRALVERGYIVVRLGDRTMTPVNVPGVVDVATLPRTSQWLDVWCILRSEFLVGSDSGPSWLAFLLGVPVLTVNAVHFRDIERPADRLICKLVRERANGHTLTISEMLTEEYLRTGLDTDRYEHLDNTPADLSDAALDMIDVVGGDRDFSPAQRRFNERLEALGRDLPRDWSGLEGIACIRKPRGTLSRRFAGKYL
jgi:putative glycosyltransferase (TIGR04372 family)